MAQGKAVLYTVQMLPLAWPDLGAGARRGWVGEWAMDMAAVGCVKDGSGASSSLPPQYGRAECVKAPAATHWQGEGEVVSALCLPYGVHMS
jgi:hypothetical protein